MKSNVDGDEPIDSFRFSEMEIENSANEQAEYIKKLESKIKELI